MEINAQTAELCGIILGDGHMHKTKNRITISGSKDDIHYFRNRVIPLFLQCFPDIHPVLVRLKTAEAYNLQVENKLAFQFFIQSYNLQRGPKEAMHIPLVILANDSLIPHFLRGLFDTDGSFKFCKQARGYAYYPRIRIALAESPLTDALQFLFTRAGFKAIKSVKLNHGFATMKNLVTYEISGCAAFERWMTHICPANPVQKAKYDYWTKYGRHEPGMIYEERIYKIASGGFEPPSTRPERAILDQLYDEALK